MKTEIISKENKLQNILDFEVCKKIVKDAVKNNEDMVILCPHYSINIQSKFEDGEELQFDMDELSEYLGHFLEVNDYDDLVIYLTDTEN